MIAIIDYGVGNLFSLNSSFSAIGEESAVTNEVSAIQSADKIILPGVGAFGDAMDKLKKTGLIPVIKKEVSKGKPLLGICLGMQLLFDKSYEYGEHDGLGLISGEVRPIKDVVPESAKIPHIGWNRLSFNGESDLFKYIKDGDYVYFVHSFYADKCRENVIADTEYYSPLAAAVANGCVYGCQFHPEKSGEVGLKILKAFCELNNG